MADRGFQPSRGEKLTVSFVSLGCPKNLVDSEALLGCLDRDDFAIVPPDSPSDVTVINTCGFVADAQRESVNAVFEAVGRKRGGKTRLVVVAGCLSQRYREEISRQIPEADLFVGVGEYERLSSLIRERLAGKGGRVNIEDPRFVPDHLTSRVRATPFYTRYVKISEGCSHRCAFCVIPFIRGKLRSRSSDSILAEIREGAASGVREFNLVAQDLNEYGRDLWVRGSLFGLLERLEGIAGDYWLRLLYMYPLQFPDRLVDLIARHARIAKYVDIPLQHVSERVLKKMNRGSSSFYVRSLVERLKTRVPGVTLRTTLLVGHPGETEGDFRELMKFVAETEFDRLGVFTYSREEGTPAFTMNGRVPERVKRERRIELMTLQQGISLRKNRALVGKTVRALYEGSAGRRGFTGSARHEGQAPEIDGAIVIRGGKARAGEFVSVRVTGAREYELTGEVV